VDVISLPVEFEQTSTPHRASAISLKRFRISASMHLRIRPCQSLFPQRSGSPTASIDAAGALGGHLKQHRKVGAKGGASRKIKTSRYVFILHRNA
jgi:hypothetical protein